MDVIRIDQLSKSHGGGFKLGPLRFTVGAGEIFGLMGPGGAGKTTLLKLIWGFSRPDHGTVRVFGLTPHLEQLSVRLRAGCLSESLQFYGWMKSRRFLEVNAGFYDRWDEERVLDVSRRFGLDLDARVDELSKGDRVKLGLTAVVAHRPQLLLLDEPALGMEIVEFLKELARQENVAIVISSRIAGDLDPIADTILTLKNGNETIKNRELRELRSKCDASC